MPVIKALVSTKITNALVTDITPGHIDVCYKVLIVRLRSPKEVRIDSFLLVCYKSPGYVNAVINPQVTLMFAMIATKIVT